MHPKALLEACTELVHDVLQLDHPADAVLSRYFRENRKSHGLGSRERHTLAEVAYSVLRYKPKYEFFARSGTGARERRLAILGYAYGLKGNRGFLNGALEERERLWLEACDKVGDSELMPQHRHNLPEWLASRLKTELAVLPTDESPEAKTLADGQTAAAFWALSASLNGSAPLDLRVNTLKEKREVAQQQSNWGSLPIEATPFSPWGLRIHSKPALNELDIFKSGSVEVQDEGSQLLALLVDAKRGEMVCDFCAGAGGKTLAIGASMRNTGRLYAFDTSAHRLEGMKPRLARSGLSNVHPVAISTERDERVKRLAGKMDRVLVDAPCSGMGTLRRNPDMKWRQYEAGLVELQAKQLAILTSAARLVKPGGRLVYATCSLLSEENEAVAEAFSGQFADFEKLDVQHLLAELKVPTPDQLTRAGYLRLWPHVHQVDGFFAAVWQRKAG